MNVPERRSSASVLRHGPHSSVADFISRPSSNNGTTRRVVPSRGHSSSPVRKALERAPISSQTIRRPPSKTIIRTTPPLDILDTPSSRHARVDMSTSLPTAIFVGGSTVEGSLNISIDAIATRKTKNLPPLSISRLSIDIIGVEETSENHRWAFLSLACEMIDAEHPPPFALVNFKSPLSTSMDTDDDHSWPLKSGASVSLPFCLNLPLNLGPPPYSSKQACIRYILAPTAVIESAEDRASLVRHSVPLQMLTVHDPEKALSSLPHPLLASDSITVPLKTASISSSLQRSIIKLTAGLHRQTWIAGSQLFVDVHVVNGHPTKPLTKVELSLEKTTLMYAHAAAGTSQKSASHLRLPRRTDSELISRSSLKASSGCSVSSDWSSKTDWKGVPPCGGSEVRTLALDVPRGCLTVSTGRYFEVRYFLNVAIIVPSSSGIGGSLFSKTVAVQLPITLIHMNSLDIVPNALAQVAAAIEEKRKRTLPIKNDREVSQYPPFHQGQAWTAPRRQSLEQIRASMDKDRKNEGNLIKSLTKDLENSPRRMKEWHTHKTNAHGNGDNPGCYGGETAKPGTRHSHTHSQNHDGHQHKYANTINTLPPHSHIANHDPPVGPPPVIPHQTRRKSSASTLDQPNRPRIPRLQLSTSGLGFSDTEFSLEADSPPRKVMLSEEERRRIVLERELRLARMRSKMLREAKERQMMENRVRRRGSERDTGFGERRRRGRSGSAGMSAGGWATTDRMSMPTALSPGSLGRMSSRRYMAMPKYMQPWGWRNVAADYPALASGSRRDMERERAMSCVPGHGMPKRSLDAEREMAREMSENMMGMGSPTYRPHRSQRVSLARREEQRRENLGRRPRTGTGTTRASEDSNSAYLGRRYSARSRGPGVRASVEGW